MAREFTIRNISGRSRQIVVPGEAPAPVAPAVAPVQSVPSVPSVPEPVEEGVGDGFDLD